MGSPQNPRSTPSLSPQSRPDSRLAGSPRRIASWAGQSPVVGVTDAIDFPTTVDVGLQTIFGRTSGTFVGTWDPRSRQFTALAAFGYRLNPLQIGRASCRERV